MTKFELLDRIAEENEGLVKTSDASTAGISKPHFYQYVKERGFEQVQHGVYLSSDAWKDAMYLLHIRCPQAIFSHDVSLYLHDMTDREPTQYTVTVKAGYNASRLKADFIKVYSVKKELHEVGLVQMKTNFGRVIPAYNAERTVCDVIRSRSNMDAQTYQDAIKMYMRRKDKNMGLLLEYAAQFHVEKILRRYLEVLL